ncbi:MAG: ATP-binding protein [Acidimicrobiia bacterium]
MTIRRRIALVSATAVAVAVILISVGTFAGARRQLMTQVDESLLARAVVIDELRPGALLALLGIERTETSSGRIVPPRPGDFDTSYYQVIFTKGRVLNVGDDDLVLPRPQRGDLDRSRPTIRSEWVDDVHLRIATTIRSEGEVIVQIARPLTEVDAVLGRLAVLLLTGGVVGVALAGGLGLVVASQAVKPISSLTATIGDIADSQAFSERVDVVGNDEVAELSKEFNLLLAELESSKEEQVRLVRDAGHELRTPLTALRTNLEVLQRHEVEPEERSAMLAAAHAEVEELAALVTEVVDLATDRYEEETIASVDLSEVAASVAERFGRRRGREVTVMADDSVVMGKQNALERAMSNIIGNADKFSPPDASVVLEITNGTVTVRDEGPGFDGHDLPYVFERFYRSDTARSEPGSGLGLSIVKQIVDDHDGEVFARNRPTGGAEVGFRLTARS